MKNNIELVKIEDLTPYAYNPRTISDEGIQKLMSDITEDPTFLNSRPLLVNKIQAGLIVYAGNQRLEACRLLGRTEVPCIVEEDLPYEVVQSRLGIDNIHFGQFDNDTLSSFDDSLLEELDIIGDFDDIDPDAQVNKPTSKQNGTFLKVESGGEVVVEPQHTIQLEFSSLEDRKHLKTMLQKIDDIYQGGFEHWLNDMIKDIPTISE